MKSELCAIKVSSGHTVTRLLVFVCFFSRLFFDLPDVNLLSDFLLLVVSATYMKLPVLCLIAALIFAVALLPFLDI